MIRIVGIQRNETPSQEFVLLQNQGGLRVNLRGHVLLSEDALSTGDLSLGHLFNDEAVVPPGMYVMLITGSGTARWGKTKDGALIYHSYMGRSESVWDRQSSPFHILNLQHTYSDRRPSVVMG